MARLELVPPDVVEIQKAIREAKEAVDVTMAHVEMAVGKVINAGRKLLAMRGQIEHGQWMAWIEENVSSVLEVSYHTTRNWMKLAEFAERRGADLDNAQTVRQAYMLAGILPEPESTEGGNSTQGNYLVHVARLERAIKAQIEARPLEKWSREDRSVLKKRLEPLVAIFEKLGAA
jgi:hypothetical protein